MTAEMIRDVLGWCTLINLALLTWWAVSFMLVRDWIHRLHGKLFDIPVERFNAIHYAGMAFFKILILVFNLVPYLALRIVV